MRREGTAPARAWAAAAPRRTRCTRSGACGRRGVRARGAEAGSEGRGAGRGCGSDTAVRGAGRQSSDRRAPRRAPRPSAQARVIAGGGEAARRSDMSRASSLSRCARLSPPEPPLSVSPLVLMTSSPDASADHPASWKTFTATGEPPQRAARTTAKPPKPIWSPSSSASCVARDATAGAARGSRAVRIVRSVGGAAPVVGIARGLVFRARCLTRVVAQRRLAQFRPAGPTSPLWLNSRGPRGLVAHFRLSQRPTCFWRRRRPPMARSFSQPHYWQMQERR